MSGSPVRDNQRSRVYSAEHVLGSEGSHDWSVKQCQAIVDSVVNTPWWFNRTRIRKVLVLDGRRRTVACADTAWVEGRPVAAIRLPRWARSKRVVLHELAHHLTPNSKAWHGPEFAANLVALVDRFWGKEEGQKLRASYREHRVKFRSPTKPTINHVNCGRCGKQVTMWSAWRVKGLSSPYFCTKKHLLAWAADRAISYAAAA